jgi:hypothetical protein
MFKKWSLLLLIMVILTACSLNKPSSSHSDMSSREAQKAGYVTNGPAGIANVDKLEAFYNLYNEKQKSQLTIVHYTDEGDPVYLDLDYDGERIKYVYDNSWDGFGGQNKGVKETSCNTLSKRTGSFGDIYGTEYFLSDCSSDIGFSNPEEGEYHLFYLEEITDEQAENIVKQKYDKPITIVSVTKKENRYEVKWEYKSNCEAGTDYISIQTGEHLGGEHSIC